ncbi:MAG: hypothetical protein Q9195_001178 [Heterodermia aff. obscurata]
MAGGPPPVAEAPLELEAHQVGPTNKGLQLDRCSARISPLYDNSMTSQPTQAAGRYAFVNGLATLQQALATGAPLNLPELYVQYKGLLRSFHRLSEERLQYLQELKIVLQDNGLIRSSARNQANGRRAAQPNNLQAQENTKRKAKRADLSQTSDAIEETLIAPQSKRVRRLFSQGEDAVMLEELQAPVSAVNGTKGGEETLMRPGGLIKHFVPPDTILSVISKAAGNTYVCASGDGENRTYLSLRAGQMGLMASYQVKAKEEEGVPREHIKIAIYDDRVGFQGPTAGVSETGDVISLANGRPMSRLSNLEAGDRAENNNSEYTSIPPGSIETGSRQDTDRPLTTPSPRESNRNPSNPVSTENSVKKSKTTQSDKIKSSPSSEAPIITEAPISREPMTTSPTVKLDPLNTIPHKPFPTLFDEDEGDSFATEQPMPASCTETTMQARETALIGTDGAEEASSSSLLGRQQQMEEPAIAALPVGAAVVESPSQSTMLGSDGILHETSQLSSHAVHNLTFHSNHDTQIPPIARVVANNVDNEGPVSPTKPTKAIGPTDSPAAGTSLSYEAADEFFDWPKWKEDRKEVENKE